MDAPGISNKKRLKIMLGIICGLFFVLSIRLVKIMVIDGDELAGRAESQQTRNTMLSATRGKILDSTGVVLARNATAYKMVVWPKSIKTDERERVARELSNLLGMDYARVLERVSSNKQEIILFVQNDKLLPKQCRVIKVNDIIDTLSKSKQEKVDCLIIQNSKETNLLFSENLENLKLIIWAHSFMSRKQWNLYAHCANVKRIVCVGNEEIEQYCG